MAQSILKRHAALLDRMATTLGVDLEEATLRSELPLISTKANDADFSVQKVEIPSV